MKRCLFLMAVVAMATTDLRADERVDELIEVLKTGNSIQRRDAANELATLGDAARPAVPWLVKLVALESPTRFELVSSQVDPGRLAAAIAIKKLEPSKLLEAMEGACNARSVMVRLWAKAAVNRLKSNADGAAPPARPRMATPGSFKVKDAAPTASQIKVGTRVYARWSDGKFYPGVVTMISGQRYSILYDDDDVGTCSLADIRLQE